jgi:hypothetical protein
MKTHQANNWMKMYGSQRRAKDKAVLQDLERQIEAEERAALDQTTTTPAPAPSRSFTSRKLHVRLLPSRK